MKTHFFTLRMHQMASALLAQLHTIQEVIIITIIIITIIILLLLLLWLLLFYRDLEGKFE